MKLEFLRKMPKAKLQKFALVGIITLCAVVGVVQFYVLRNWSEFIDAKRRIVKVNDQIQETEREAQRAIHDEAYRGQVKSFVETQETAMIAGDPFEWVVREMSLFTEKQLVHVDGLHPGGIDSADRYKSRAYTLRIEFSGTYDQIGVFIQDLENKFPTSEIRSLSVSGGGDDKGVHQAMANLVLRMQPEQTSKKAEAKKTS